MKYLQVLLLWVCAFAALPIIAYSETTKVVTLNFDYNDFHFETVDGCLQISSDKYNLFFKEDTLAPALPYICINVLIGPKDKYITHKTSITTQSSLGINIDLNPNPSIESNTIISPHNLVTPVTNNFSDSIYPAKNVEYTRSYNYDGVRYLSFVVCPFTYRTNFKRLLLLNTIKIKINLEEDIAYQPNALPACLNIRESTFKDINQTIINANEFGTLYNHFFDLPYIENDTTYKYIIITPSNFINAFKPLAIWKTMKGIRTKIIDVNSLITEFPSNSVAMCIKKAIKYYRDKGAEYILLGGDGTQVYNICCQLPWPDETLLPSTDLYYSCLNTMDWDLNGNGIYGENSDSIDISPIIAVTRLPVNNPADVSSFVNRIISYECNPTFAKSDSIFLLCGNMLRRRDTISSGLISSDVQQWGDSIFYKYIYPFSSFERFRLYDTISDSPLGLSYRFTAENFQQELQKGYPFVYIDTHGSQTSFAVYDAVNNPLNPATYSYNQAENLHNIGESLIITSACKTNDFAGAEPCLSESFLRNPNSGIIAYMGSSTIGLYFRNSKKIGPSDEFNGHIFRAILSKKDNHLGKALNEARWIWKDTYLTNPQHKIILYGVNAMGDPEMPIYTEKPIEFDSISISVNNGNLNIYTDIDSCSICVASLSDMGSSMYRIIKNTQQTELNLLADSVSICITRPGYKPFLAFATPNSLILQNQSFHIKHHFSAATIKIGKELIAPYNFFQPIINKGNTTLSSSNSVEIYDNFEISKGSSFSIQ